MISNQLDLAGCSGIEGFKVILNDIWFGMYDRKAPDDTSGYTMSIPIVVDCGIHCVFGQQWSFTLD